MNLTPQSNAVIKLTSELMTLKKEIMLIYLIDYLMARPRPNAFLTAPL